MDDAPVISAMKIAALTRSREAMVHASFLTGNFVGGRDFSTAWREVLGDSEFEEVEKRSLLSQSSSLEVDERRNFKIDFSG